MNFLNLTSEIAVMCVLAGWSKLSGILCTSPPSPSTSSGYNPCCARNLGVWLKKQISCLRETKVNPVKQLYSLNLFSSLKWRNLVWLWTEATFYKKEGIRHRDETNKHPKEGLNSFNWECMTKVQTITLTWTAWYDTYRIRRWNWN